MRLLADSSWPSVWLSTYTLYINYITIDIPTKFEHSSRSIGRILFLGTFSYILFYQNLSIAPAALGFNFQVFRFFYILSQQNLSIAPAALGRYCFVEFFLYFILPKFEHSSRGIGLQLSSVQFFLHSIPTKFEHSSRSIGQILFRGVFLIFYTTKIWA